MKKKLSVLIILILSCSLLAEDTTDTPSFCWPEQIVPLTLTATGIGLCFGSAKQTLQNKIPRTSTRIDDVTQYLPMVEMYTADIFSRSHANSVFDQTKYLLIAQITNGIFVQGLKHIIKTDRPDNSNDNSFPSGHTSTAFVGATILYHEYKNQQPILAYSGYLFAISTGILRVTNNKHWVPDVLAGAGFGMLIANLTYHFKPLQKWQPFKKRETALLFSPLFDESGPGFDLSFSQRF